MDMREHTEIPILPFRAMDKINIKMDEVCGVARRIKSKSVEESNKTNPEGERKQHTKGVF